MQCDTGPSCEIEPLGDVIIDERAKRIRRTGRRLGSLFGQALLCLGLGERARDVAADLADDLARCRSRREQAEPPQ